jgi:predicted NUDIX family NTP pyrophosphohydrolase
MPKRSAGLLVFRRAEGRVEVLLVHPGGPFWVKKDEGAWSIPKGEIEPGDDGLAEALREFREELGVDPPDTRSAIPLGEVRQSSAKDVEVWAIEGDVDLADVSSNTFTMEWPPRSGRHVEFPEVDRAGWFDLVEARRKLLRGQLPFVDRLAGSLDSTA